MTRRRLARVLRWIDVPLIVVGLALLSFYTGARIHGAVASAQALREFDLAQVERAAAPPTERAVAPAAAPALPSLERPDQSQWDRARIAAYRSSLAANVGAPIGVLTIPKIALRVPIFEGTSDLTLNRGVGTIEGTAAVGARGNLGIAGHRDGFFRGLRDVRAGDTIDVEWAGGTTHYRITEIVIVEPSDVHVLDPTDGATLTLVTCYPFYVVGSAPRRYIVKATKTAA